MSRSPSSARIEPAGGVKAGTETYREAERTDPPGAPPSSAPPGPHDPAMKGRPRTHCPFSLCTYGGRDHPNPKEDGDEQEESLDPSEGDARARRGLGADCGGIRKRRWEHPGRCPEGRSDQVWSRAGMAGDPESKRLRRPSR